MRLCKINPNVQSTSGLNSSDRMLIATKLRHTVIPTAPFLKFYQQLYDLIIAGYECRNPLEPKVIEWNYSLADPDISDDELEQLITTDGTDPTTLSLIVSGLSGMGKSKMIRAVLSGAFPNLIVHDRDDFDEIQVVYLLIEMPSNATQKEIFGNIIREIDRTLDSRISEKYIDQVKSKNNLASIETLRATVTTLCATYHVGAILIDEFQNLNVASKAHYEETLQLFDSLSNLLNLPIIKIGTNESLKHFRTQFRHCRRAGDLIELAPYPRVIPSSESDEIVTTDWKRLVTAALAHQVIENPIEYSTRLDQELYKYSCGIPYVLFRLWTKVQIDAVRLGKKEIHLKDIKQSYDRHFKLIRLALNALRSKRNNRFQDLLNVNQLFDTGEFDLAIKHLNQLVNKDNFTGVAAKELIDAIDDEMKETEFSEKQLRAIEKVRQKLSTQSAKIKAGQTIDLSPDRD